MRTLDAVSSPDPPFKIKDVPVKQNPTPKATDEKGNPKHWVRLRMEKQRSLSGLPPAEGESPRVIINQSDEATDSSRWSSSSPSSGREEVLSPSWISGHLPDLVDEEWLVQCTGATNLQEVSRLALKIDTNLTTIERIGSYLPCLQTLVLSNSRIASIRDLGTSLGHVMRLELSQCGIEGLEGMAALSGLRELYLSHNRVSDTTPLAMHDHLQLLDLSYNRVADLSSVEMLSTCPQLHTLSLSHNPVWTLGACYRRVVGSSIPQVNVLDGKKIAPEEKAAMDDELMAEASETLKHFDVSRPKQYQHQPGADLVGPQTTMSSSPQQDGDDGDPDSKLTQEAGFFAGNPSSMRSRGRRQQQQQQQESSSSSSEEPQAWTGTILEVLDNPDRDIDITPPEPEVRDWRSSEAIRGNPMLASLYESMVDSSTAATTQQPLSLSSPSWPVGSRRSKSVSEGSRHKGRRRAMGAMMDAADGDDDGGDDNHDDGDASVHRRYSSSHHPGLLNLPMPVRIERRGGGLMTTTTTQPSAPRRPSISEQRRLRRRWSKGAGREEGGGGGASDADSGEESSGGEDNQKEAAGVTRPVLAGRLASEAQKAGVRMGFNLSESLAAIDQWIEEVDDDDDGIVAHRSDILAKVPARRRPASDSSPTPGLVRPVRRPSPPSSSSKPEVSSHPSRSSSSISLTTSTSKDVLLRHHHPPPSTASSSSSSPTTASPSPLLSPPSSCATALALDDDTLVRMLMRPPKSLPQLRTREAFRAFFRGMPAGRMQGLLMRAYVGRDPQEIRVKVIKRLELLHDVLV